MDIESMREAIKLKKLHEEIEELSETDELDADPEDIDIEIEKCEKQISNTINN